MANEHTKPSAETRAEEAREARADHRSDRPPTREEEARAEQHRPDPSAAEHAKEMGERGAKQKGEGRLPG